SAGRHTDCPLGPVAAPAVPTGGARDPLRSSGRSPRRAPQSRPTSSARQPDARAARLHSRSAETGSTLRVLAQSSKALPAVTLDVDGRDEIRRGARLRLHAAGALPCPDRGSHPRRTGFPRLNPRATGGGTPLK